MGTPIPTLIDAFIITAALIVAFAMIFLLIAVAAETMESIEDRLHERRRHRDNARCAVECTPYRLSLSRRLNNRDKR